MESNKDILYQYDLKSKKINLIKSDINDDEYNQHDKKHSNFSDGNKLE